VKYGGRTGAGDDLPLSRASAVRSASQITLSHAARGASAAARSGSQWLAVKHCAPPCWGGVSRGHERVMGARRRAVQGAGA